MEKEYQFKVIGRVRSDFKTKFAIPRQSSLAEELVSCLVLEPDYRDRNILRGIEEFTHLWLLWVFSENADNGWSATVRPPRLGGNTRIGVFATRSPFRPNPIGLSCVKLLGIKNDDKEGPVLILGGADLMDGTPILDIKPYIPYTDARPEASPGYTAQTLQHVLDVVFPNQLLEKITPEKREALIAVLRQDPRPSYQHDAARIYGFGFADWEIRFRVDGDVLTVIEVDTKRRTE